MASYYYLNERNEQMGPFELADLLHQGIGPKTLVWTKGMSDWLPAERVAEVKKELDKAAGMRPAAPPVAPPRPPMQPTGALNKPYNWLVWAILSTVLCCVPLGIVAIVFSSKANKLWAEGNHEGAVKASHTARLFVIISASCGFVGGILMFIAAAMG